MPKGVLYDYYPDPSYIKKKWKPEKIPAESLQALANAEVTAVRQGVLSPNVAQQFLPNALAEGRSTQEEDERGNGTSADFGFNSMQYNRSPVIDDKIRLMGLNAIVGSPDITYNDRHGYVPANLRSDMVDPSVSARMAAIMLSHKASLYGEDKAVERWNGQGQMALNHARKVGVLSQMLNHPSNNAILNAYLKMKYPE